MVGLSLKHGLIFNLFTQLQGIRLGPPSNSSPKFSEIPNHIKPQMFYPNRPTVMTGSAFANLLGNPLNFSLFWTKHSRFASPVQQWLGNSYPKWGEECACKIENQVNHIQLALLSPQTLYVCTKNSH